MPARRSQHWLRASALAPGDLTCGFTDVPPDDGAAPQLDELRLLFSAVNVGSGYLQRLQCYTVVLRPKTGELEPRWFEPWLERSACYVVADDDNA